MTIIAMIMIYSMATLSMESFKSILNSGVSANIHWRLAKGNLEKWSIYIVITVYLNLVRQPLSWVMKPGSGEVI